MLRNLRMVKILILEYEGIIKNEPRVYESVDDGSMSKVIYQQSTEKRIHAIKNLSE